MEDVIKKVADLAKEKSWHEIMETYILPEVLKKGGSARGYKISDDFMPCFTALAMYSGNKTAESVVLKNFSTVSEPTPLTLISNLFRY